ncbi:MAG: zinc metalloprotease HtpX [Sedimentisphaerales bacterium]|nr:zinc metalloprotease HtpX [Sedimentisphaerales bacterium]
MFRFMNNVKTFMLLAGMMVLFVYVGSLIGGRQGMIIALLLGGGMNIAAYFFSDKLALASMRAQPVSEDQAPELVGIVRDLARQAQIPMPRVYVCPPQAPNAFATGRNPRNAAVAVTRGLLELVNRDELTGVLAHEIAHVKHRDILIQTVAATIAGAISALGYILWFVPLGGSGNDRRGGNPLAAIAMIILAPIAALLIQMAISRRREYNADSYGAELAGSPLPLATALQKLHEYSRRIPMRVPLDSQKSMFIVQPFSGRDAADLFNTHPSLANRLKALIGREHI